MVTTALQPETEPKQGRLPMAALLALFTAGFVAVLTETLPAGLLPQMSAETHDPPRSTIWLLMNFPLYSPIAPCDGR